MEKYLIIFPVWIAVSNAHFDLDGEALSFDDVGVIFNERSVAVAIFTEELFAERFAEMASDSQTQQSQVARFDDPIELAKLLEDQLQRGCRFVAIDPQSATKPVPAMTIREAIETFRRGSQEA